MLKIDSREALNSVRSGAKEVIDNSKCRILICAGTGCLAGGSAQIHEKMLELVNANPNIEVHFGPEIAHGDEDHHRYGEIGVKKSGCHGFCEMGPLMRIEPMGILYTKVSINDCEEIFEKTIKNGEIIDKYSPRDCTILLMSIIPS